MYTPTFDPTMIPTTNPTTPSPTNPSPIVCGEGSLGTYNGGTLEIEIETDFEGIGDIIVDATLSTFTITALRGYDGETLKGSDGGSGDWDETKNDVLRLHNVAASRYTIQIEGLEEGTYVVTTECLVMDSVDTTTSPKVLQSDDGLNDTTQHLLIIGAVVIIIAAIIGCTVCYIAKPKLAKQGSEHLKMEMVTSTSGLTPMSNVESADIYDAEETQLKENESDLMKHAVNAALPKEGNDIDQLVDTSMKIWNE